jgi:hypothetical protein
MTSNEPTTPTTGDVNLSDEAVSAIVERGRIAERIDEAYRRLLDGDGFEMKVSGKKLLVKPHPLSVILPLISREEFGELVEDIAEHSFQQAITLTTLDEVLEGRHRVAAAYALGAPLLKATNWDAGKSVSSQEVPTRGVACGYDTFTGTNEEARDLVISANVHRRHLNNAQKAWTVRQLFLPQAKAEAEARMLAGSKLGNVENPTANLQEGQGEATAAAVKKSGIPISPRSVASLAIVDHAPKTQSRILSGTINTVSEAEREARKEIEASDTKPEGWNPEVIEGGKSGSTKSGKGNGTGKGKGKDKPTPIPTLLKAARDALQEAVDARTAGRTTTVKPEEQRKLIGAIENLCANYSDLLDDEA